MNPAHHTAQPTPYPAQTGKILTCGPENVREFNAALRNHAPEAFDLAKALHAAGLLDGLRGARLAIGGPLPSSGGLTLGQICTERWHDPKARP